MSGDKKSPARLLASPESNGPRSVRRFAIGVIGATIALGLLVLFWWIAPSFRAGLLWTLIWILLIGLIWMLYTSARARKLSAASKAISEPAETPSDTWTRRMAGARGLLIAVGIAVLVMGIGRLTGVAPSALNRWDQILQPISDFLGVSAVAVAWIAAGLWLIYGGFRAERRD